MPATHVLTLVLAVPEPSLVSRLSEAVAPLLTQHGLSALPPVWLSPNRAWDCPLSGSIAANDFIKLRERLKATLDPLPCDWALFPLAHREKRLLVADMDSTILEGECIDELAARLGIGEAIADITRRTMNGELAFEESLRLRVAMLKGMPVSVIDEVLAEIRPSAGAAVLLRTLRRRGCYTALVSGGFRPFTAAVRRQLGFDYDESNTLIVQDGRLTGELGLPIVGPDAKQSALLRLAEAQNIPMAATLAVGDGANDLGMIRVAGLGVAYRAKPVVADAAQAAIRVSDLTTLLFFQGIPESAFALD
jgi:phosphoserine phosphatase